MKWYGFIYFLIPCVVIVFFFSCGEPHAGSAPGKRPASRVSEVPLPPGFSRTTAGRGSFGHFLRNLRLKKPGTPVRYFNGKLKPDQGIHYAVIDMDVGKADLQQCADAVMRLRGEYLFRGKRYGKIHFNFTSGDRVGFIKWAEGYRPVVRGRKVFFRKKGKRDYSYRNFRRYMVKIFQYAGSMSLSRELVRVRRIEDLGIGHIFVQGGYPGHAVIVLDVAVNKKTGEKIFLLAQSYMPAQSIHILKNIRNSSLSPWYSTGFADKLTTPEWVFKKSHLMRFP
jgi:hypothetical protein